MLESWYPKAYNQMYPIYSVYCTVNCYMGLVSDRCIKLVLLAGFLVGYGQQNYANLSYILIPLGYQGSHVQYGAGGKLHKYA